MFILFYVLQKSFVVMMSIEKIVSIQACLSWFEISGSQKHEISLNCYQSNFLQMILC